MSVITNPEDVFQLIRTFQMRIPALYKFKTLDGTTYMVEDPHDILGLHGPEDPEKIEERIVPIGDFYKELLDNEPVVCKFGHFFYETIEE